MKKQIIRGMAFGLMTVLCLLGVSRIAVANLGRYGFSHKDFYEMEDDLDVAFVGASHAYCGFNPQILRETIGATGYVFGSPNQSMLANYLWAKEAYATNPYDVLVVEAMSFPISHGEIDADIRSLCGMVQSPYFYELALTYKRNALNILFPVFLLHDEWEYLDDGIRVTISQRNEGTNFGHVQLDSCAGENYTEPLIKGEEESEAYLNFTYIDKIRSFCEEKGIKLIVVKTIMASNDVNDWNDEYHYTVSQYCDEYRIPFIDFNTAEYIEAAGLSVAFDVAEDLRHANGEGAKKMTRYLADVIGTNLDGKVK